jgi:hypothetical protein
VEAKPRGYLEQSRNLTNSLILVAPVLVLYEAGLLLTDFEGLNGVDFITVLLLHYLHLRGLIAFDLIVLAGIAIAAHMRRKERSLSPDVIPIVVLESATYALTTGFVISFILRQVPLGPPRSLGPVAATVASLGAGVNEEVFFRLCLLTAIAWTLEDKAGSRKALARFVAAVLSSLAFSAAHYVPGGDAFELYSFLYRFLAGMIFAGIFLGRGLAVAVYTHAIYDIFVLVLLAR